MLSSWTYSKSTPPVPTELLRYSHVIAPNDRANVFRPAFEAPPYNPMLNSKTFCQVAFKPLFWGAAHISDDLTLRDLFSRPVPLAQALHEVMYGSAEAEEVIFILTNTFIWIWFVFKQFQVICFVKCMFVQGWGRMHVEIILIQKCRLLPC